MIELTGYVIPFVIAGIVCMVLIVLSILSGSTVGSPVLIWILAAVFVWALASAVGQYGADLNVMRLSRYVEGVCRGLLAPLWLALTFYYTGLRLRRNKLLAAAAVVYVLLFISQFMKPGDFYLISMYIWNFAGRPCVKITYGPFYYITMLLYIVSMIWSVIVAIRAYRLYAFSQNMLALFLLATGVPVLVGLLYVIRLLPLDITPLLYTSSCGVLVWMSYGLDFSEVLAGIRGIGPVIRSGIILVDQNGMIREMNGAAAEILQVDAAESCQKPLIDLLRLPVSIAELNASIEVEIPRKDGNDPSAVRLYVSEVNGSGGKARGKLIFMDDIGSIKQTESKLDFISNFDRVTGLPNRFQFMLKLKEALEEAEATGTVCAVLIVDLCGFRRINEEYGYGEGDNILRAFALRLGKLVTRSETLCRFSSDDFHILMTGLKDPEHEVRALADAIIDSLDTRFLVENTSEKLDVNIGAAFAPADGHTADQLLGSANIALNHSASLSRNTLTMYSDEVTQRLLEKERLLDEMRLGLRLGQFEVVYQPQLDLKQRAVFGVEALVRWNHPERGTISPAVFIPLAENSGFISFLGMFILEQSCRQIARWRSEGFNNIKMGVNISVVQLYDEEFVDKVFDLVYRYSIPLAFLELEITESIALDENKVVQENVKRLRESGFRIAIDDFGMGHSTLMYLTHFPVHTLKLDSALVRYIQRNHNAAVIVEAIAMICENMGIELIAEGVETTELCNAVQKIGCHLFQGYLFSRPLPVRECPRFFTEGPMVWSPYAQTAGMQ